MAEIAENTHGSAKRVIGTPFKKGNPGKPKGTQNKITRTVKETVLAVFNSLQADPKANLESWAKEAPTEFYRIAAKLIPTDIRGEVKTTSKILLQVVRKDTPATPEQPARESAGGN